MSEPPLPPFMPSDLESFQRHAAEHSHEWFEYCQKAYTTLDRQSVTIRTLEAQNLEVVASLQQKEQEVMSLQNQVTKLQGIQDYQREELDRLNDRLATARANELRAMDLATPAVPAPISLPLADQPAKETLTPPAREITPATTSPSETNRLSERLPDPEKFEGTKTDLRRFTAQVRAKMNANRDRFYTAQSRVAYVASRLGAIPYAQVLPYMKGEQYLLSDYEDVLKLLERAFGDPNRVNNARKALFALRQAHREFGAFFAEFQRLALEGEMSEDSLSTLLEQAISKELKSQLMNVSPPSRKFHEYAAFLQDLENRRRYFDNSPMPRTYPAAAASATATTTPTRNPPPIGDPMDLSSSRRYQPRPASKEGNRKEQGLCYRCGSANHLVAHCPHPDTRTVRTRPMVQQPEPSRTLSRENSPRRSQSPRRLTYRRRSSASGSQENGVGLN